MTASGFDESLVEKKKRARKIVQALKKAYPKATCALNHRSPFELLVATILAAQCTDERVNQVTPELFAKYPTAEALAKARQQDVERLIQSTGFYRNKATALRQVARALVERHGGEVPRSLEQLVQLPGVGRKTANVVLGTACGIPSGIVVDTHVKRIARRLGLTTNTNPDKIEQDLVELVPKAEWIDFSHRLIQHGREVCTARKPNCLECPLLKYCPRCDLPPLDAGEAAVGPEQAKPRRTAGKRSRRTSKS